VVNEVQTKVLSSLLAGGRDDFEGWPRPPPRRPPHRGSSAIWVVASFVYFFPGDVRSERTIPN